jgi:transcription antitermination factor NusB
MGQRTQGRELALQLLYQQDLLPGLAAAERDEFLRAYGESDDVRRFARSLAEGVTALREDLDRRIARVAENWTIARMAVIDRNILRIGLWELLRAGDVPDAVVIDEAVELAKKFSSKNAGAFVNGILDRLLRERGERGERGDGRAADQAAGVAAASGDPAPPEAER